MAAPRKRSAARNNNRRLWTWITRGGGLAGFAVLLGLAALKIDVPQQLYFLTGGLLFGKEIVQGRLKLTADENDEDDDAA